MANNCFYRIVAVSKNKDSLIRLFNIMNYNDPEYHLYRVFSVGVVDGGDAEDDPSLGIFETDDGYFSMDLYGDVAWGCDNWFTGEDDPSRLILESYEKDENGREDFDKPIYGTSHYTTLNHLAKVLGFGLELWSEERGMCFQQHFLVNANGEVCIEEHKPWDGYSEDEWENTPEDEKKEMAGDDKDWVPNFGFGDDWGDCMSADEMYNYKKNGEKR